MQPIEVGDYFPRILLNASYIFVSSLANRSGIVLQLPPRVAHLLDWWNGHHQRLQELEHNPP